MPSMLMLADTQFPRFTEGEGSDEKFDKVYNYLYMLLEQLRYTLTNLGSENFNTSDLGEIGEVITEPLSDELQIFRRAMVGENGDISQIAQSGESIISRISSADGKISTLTQTSSSLSSRLTAAEGEISEIKQTPYGLELSVSNEGTSSTIRLLANGTQISSATVIITGAVTFADLEGERKTVINGSNITTGTINGDRIYGGTIAGSKIYGGTVTGSLVDIDSTKNAILRFWNGNYQIGEVATDTNAAGTGKALWIVGNSGNAIKLHTQGNISIDAGGTVFLYNVQIANSDNGAGAWTFTSGGIKYNNNVVVAV